MNVGRRYAKALFQIAAEQNKIDQFMEELNLLKRFFDESSECKTIFVDRLMEKEQKINIMSKICSRIELSEETEKLLVLLINGGREQIFNGIVMSYEQMYDDYKGIIKVDVYTAYDLVQEEIDTLKTRIKEMFNKDPVLHIIRDDYIIGGLKLKVGWTIYDGTIKTQLKDFTESIKI